MAGKTVKFGSLFECVAELFPPELSQAPMSTMMFKAKIDRVGFSLIRQLHQK
jgi:hypothetical protein